MTCSPPVSNNARARRNWETSGVTGLSADLADLTSALVAIDSVNPGLVPGAAGEAELATFVAGWFEQAGLEVRVVEPRPGRPSVIATAHGRGGGRSLLLNAHLDTVGVAGMDGPHEPRREGNRLYGRGAYDTKGGLAACMAAAAGAMTDGLSGDVIVAAVADEEFASLGSFAIVGDIRADAAIVSEPTGMDQIWVAHKGFAWLEILTRGRAAHGSLPDIGVDAIVHMGAVLSELERLSGELALRRHDLLGASSLHASLISGGQELSSYPEECRLRIERRTVPGETAASVQREIEAVVQACRTDRRNFDAQVETLLWRDPFAVDQGAEIITSVTRAATAVLGVPPAPVGAPAWTDAAVFAEAGIPAVIYGPGGDGAHALVEWVDLDDVARCSEVYRAVARHLCA
jgi:acetylornithine deacetylase